MAEKISEMTWRLSDPGMDLLERAGLAGLYMALQAAKDQNVDLSPLQWADGDLTPDSVTVRWTGSAKDAFSKLMRWAWQVKDGLFFFPAVHEDDGKWWYRESMHNGLMRTYFQIFQVQPALDAVTRIVQLTEDKIIKVQFKIPGERVEAPELGTNKVGKPKLRTVPTTTVKPHRDTEEKLFDKKGEWQTKLVSLSNWLYPGSTGRYAHEESWFGAANRALLLMLAPTICLFLRLQGEGGNWVIVVPDIRDLENYAIARKRMVLDAHFTDVASLGDAGLQFLAEYSTRDPRKKLQAGCRVIAMGNVNYYPNQSIRKAVLDVSDHHDCVKRYRVLQQVFHNHFQRINREQTQTGQAKLDKKSKKSKPNEQKPESQEPQANGWYKLPTGRGRIADNLVNDRPWYENLFVPMPWDEKELEQQRKQSDKGTSTERVWFTALAYQRSKLMRLIQEDIMWDSEAEKLFVQVFWETLDSLYAQEAKATERGGSRTTDDRFEHLNEDIRRRLMHAKTRVLLRAALSELFAKAGGRKTLSTCVPAIWRLIDDPEQWQKGRDLALLALASHRNRAIREGKNQDSETQTSKG